MKHLNAFFKIISEKSIEFLNLKFSFLFFFFSFSLLGHSQAFQWAVQSGGNGVSSTSDRGEAVATDILNNVIIAGAFEDIAFFDTVSLTSAGNLDIFIEKRTSDGSFEWAVRAGGTQLDKPNAVCTDIFGNVYITGQYNGTATFGTSSITSNGIDIFVAKYNSDGVFQWVRSAGGSSVNRGLGIAADTAGNVIVVGDFGGTATFGSTNVTSAGAVDIFIAKYNTNGTLLWVERAGGTVNDRATDVKTDIHGNIYITGSFGGTANFDGIIVNATGGAFDTDIFVAKYTPLGSSVWVKMAGTTGGSVEEAKGVDVDNAGNVYICGVFYGTVSFDGVMISSYGSSDAFIAKYNNAGVIQWVRNVGGTTEDEATSVAVSNNGTVLMAGFFKGTASAGPFTLNAFAGAADLDGFLVKYDTLGNEIWATKMGRSGEDKTAGVAADLNGNIYVTGYFKYNILFDQMQLTSQGSSDAFLAMINDYITIDTLSQHLFCAGDSIVVNYNVNGNFGMSNVFTVELSDHLGSFLNPQIIASVSSTSSGVISTLIPPSAPQGNNYRIRILASEPYTVSHIYQLSITINGKPAMPTAVSQTNFCANDSVYYIEVSGSDVFWYSDDLLLNEIANDNTLHINQILANDTSYFVVDVTTSGCISEISEILVSVNPLPVLNYLGADTMEICENEPLVHIDISPSGGVFSGNGIVNTDYFDPAIAQTGFHPITYIYTDSNSCIAEKSIYFDVLPVPLVNIDTTDTIFIYYYDTLFLSATPSGGTFYGSGVTGNYFVGTQGLGCSPCIISYVYTALNGCSDTASIQVFNYVNNIDEAFNPFNINVYPNPFLSVINIETDIYGDYTILLYDNKGSELFRKIETANKTVVNIPNLSSGVYFLKIIFDNGVYFDKIIKTNMR